MQHSQKTTSPLGSELSAFSLRKLLVITIIIILWTGLYGVVEYFLAVLMGENASQFQRFMYNLGLTVIGIILVYALNISPALIV